MKHLYSLKYFLCMIWQALHIRIWQLSAICLLVSSPLKLCQVRWGKMHIFRFLQKYLIAFKPRLWLGHSRTFTELSISHSCCVLKVIFLLEGEPSVQSEVLNALDWVYIKAQYFIAFLLLWSPSVPAAEKQPHSMRLLPAHFTLGMVLCRWWEELVAFKHEAWNWGLSNQIISFLTDWGSLSCFFVKSMCVFMCLHWFWFCSCQNFIRLWFSFSFLEPVHSPDYNRHLPSRDLHYHEIECGTGQRLICECGRVETCVCGMRENKGVLTLGNLNHWHGLFSQPWFGLKRWARARFSWAWVWYACSVSELTSWFC